LTQRFEAKLRYYRVKQRRKGWKSSRPASLQIIRVRSEWSVQLVPLREELVRSSRTELLLVFGAVFCLLLLVCANVASLAIARRAARAREISGSFFSSRTWL
jgi:hypothetical protein